MRISTMVYSNKVARFLIYRQCNLLSSEFQASAQCCEARDSYNILRRWVPHNFKVYQYTQVVEGIVDLITVPIEQTCCSSATVSFSGRPSAFYFNHLQRFSDMRLGTAPESNKASELSPYTLI